MKQVTSGSLDLGRRLDGACQPATGALVRCRLESNHPRTDYRHQNIQLPDPAAQCRNSSPAPSRDGLRFAHSIPHSTLTESSVSPLSRVQMTELRILEFNLVIQLGLCHAP